MSARPAAQIGAADVGEAQVDDPGAPGLREKMIKIDRKLVRHAWHLTFQTTEVAVRRELFAAILVNIQRLGVPPPLLRPA